MPPGGVEHRGEQLALLAGLLHERGTDPRLGDLLAAVEGSRPRGRPRRRPPPSTSASSAASTTASCGCPARWSRSRPAPPRWRSRPGPSARGAADFARFRPWLERIVELKRAEAECVGYADEPYDALLEDYEPGLRAARSSPGCSRPSGRELVPLAERDRRRAPRGPDSAVLRRALPDRPAAALRRGGGRAPSASTSTAGRLDLGAHPFCTGIGPGDCRITTRFDARDFAGGLFGILHEVGHGLYEQGLDPEHYGTPMGEAASRRRARVAVAALGEPRSAASRPLLGPLLPRGPRALPRGPGRRRARRVPLRGQPRRAARSIRVQADEVTYNLHILIRFELERALISGDAGGGRPARRLERGVSATPRRRAARTTPRAACRTATGRTG